MGILPAAKFRRSFRSAPCMAAMVAPGPVCSLRQRSNARNTLSLIPSRCPCSISANDASFSFSHRITNFHLRNTCASLLSCMNTSSHSTSADFPCGGEDSVDASATSSGKVYILLHRLQLHIYLHWQMWHGCRYICPIDS